jgi:hypothetical protein
MGWVRLDDGLNEHPKVAALNHEEFHLWASALILASRQLYAMPDAEPGYLTDSQIHALARQKLCQFRAIGGLVRQGLFEQLEGGIHLHDFEQYLAPDWASKRDRLREISEIRRRAGQKGGQASVEARLTLHGSAQPKQTPKQTGRFASSDHEAAPKQTPKQTSSKPEAPVPVPVPVVVSNTRRLGVENDSSDQGPTAGAVERVFEAWTQATGRTGRTVLTPKRRRVIRLALVLYGEPDCTDAVRGWRHSPHHRGENDRGTVYNDLELLLRDAKHIEQFRDLERNGAPAIAMPSKPTLSDFYRQEAERSRLQDEAASRNGSLLDEAAALQLSPPAVDEDLP